MAKVLLVDDEVTMVQMVSEMLRAEGHEVHPFTSIEPALEGIVELQPELVITDLYLDKTRAHGLEILQKARSINPPASVIMVTGFGSIETAVKAMKEGAYDYIEKPFKLDELRLCVQRALSYNQAISENVYLKKQLRKKYRFDQIIGTAEPMQDVFKMIEKVADTDSTILILGESGTGKELVAKALHYNSRRQFAPFIPVNCSALPENLLESELFGHRKGAFTGAVTDKNGLFQEADGGTIFLDEIGTMSPTLQSRLLRVLQEKEVRRVGDNTPVYVDVRVLAATNEPLEEMIKNGEFREDLYYRLNVISIQLPSLNDRSDDVPLLVAHFLRSKLDPKTGGHYEVTRHAMDLMQAYSWPGNVRELENAIERACALCEDRVIRADDLPPKVAAIGEKIKSSDTEIVSQAEAEGGPRISEAALFPLAGDSETDGKPLAPSTPAATNSPIGPLKNFVREQEVSYIHRVLAQTGGDKEQAADILGVSLATLYRKLTEEE